MWIWPRALPLAGIFGPAWDGPDVRARFLTLTSQWQARHPAPAAPRPDAPAAGQWMWQPPAHRIYDCHTYDTPDDDWLEVMVRMETTELSDGCRIGAELAVACRCDTPHGRHSVVEVLWRAGGPGAALDTLTTVLRYTDQWLTSSRRPGWWREQAGL